MNDIIKFSPDRWLLCSPAIADGIAPWMAEAGDDSLGALRLRSGLVETVALDKVSARVNELQAVGPVGCIHVVFGTMGDAEREVRRQLSSQPPGAVSLYAWKAQASDVIASLSSPEPAVSMAWMKHREMPSRLQVDAAVPDHWLDQYRAALTVWAAAVQREVPWELGSRIVNSPICRSVTDLLQALGQTAASAVAGAASVAAEAPRFARMVASSMGLGAPGAAGLAAGAADSGSSSKDTVREWRPAAGVSVLVTVAQGATEATVSLTVEVPIVKMRRITRVELSIGDQAIDFATGGDAVSWSELENNRSMTVVLVPLTDQFAREISAPDTEIELSFMSR